MLGEKFVSTCDRLLKAVDQVITLAQQAGSSIEGAEYLSSLRDALEQPFLITVCGEVNVGKSSLINALHGRYLCKVSDLPETGIPTLHSFGQQRSEKNHGDKWMECQWADESLKHVHWLDMPGIEQVGKAAVSQWQPWLEVSDVLIVVFSYRNLWGTHAWDFITKLPPEMLPQLVLVVQGCDEAEQTELPVMLDHVRDLARKRLDLVPPVFLVSARQGFEARSHRGTAVSWEASGIPPLEQWLEHRITTNQEHQRAMEALRRKVLQILHEIDEALDRRSRHVLGDVKFLEQIEQEIDAMLQQTVRDQLLGVGAIGDEYIQQANAMARTLRSRLGCIRSFWRIIAGDTTAQRLEIMMQQRLTKAVKSAAERDARKLMDGLSQHWVTVDERLFQLLGKHGPPWWELESRLKSASEQLVERMATAAVRGMSQLRVRSALSTALRKRRKTLIIWTALMLISLTAAGVSGGMFLPWLPTLFSSAALIFAVLFAVHSIKTAREIVQQYKQRLLHSSEAFFAGLRGDYEVGLRLFFREYAQGLQNVRQSLSARENSLQPLLQRWNELFLKIKAIEQEMGL